MPIRHSCLPLIILACALAHPVTAAEPAALAEPAGEAVLAAGPGPAVLGGREARVRLVRRGPLGLVRVEDSPAGPVRQGVQAVQRREMIGDHLLVRLAPGADPAQVARDLGGAVRGRAGRDGPWLISLPVRQHADLPAAFSRLGADKRVVRVEPDWIIQPIGIPDDPSFAQLWGMHNTGQDGGTDDADIDAPEAWSIATGSRSVLVGVIDTGIDRDHPDLAANMWTNPGESGLDGNGLDRRSNGLDDDGNGFIDDWRGWDFLNNDNDPTDDYGHGTHCAGSIGAVGGNATGVTGVCWQVSMVGIKFLGTSGGTTAGAIASVDYARTIGCTLTSNSWGGGGFSQELSDAIAANGAAGQLFVAAAGNSAGNNDVVPSYPASYPLWNILAVAATDRNDALASFSCYGASSVDIGAPGVDILSTLPGNLYGTYSGTSMATPHVAGACALLRSVNQSLSAAELKQALLDLSDPIPSLTGRVVSGGRLNLHRALVAVAGPQLAAESIVVAELGDGDGVLNPGESARITLTLRSAGTEMVSSAIGSLSTSDGQAVVVDGGNSWGDLAPGSISAGDGSFIVRLPASTPTPRQVPLTITVTASTGGPWSFPLVLPYRSSVRLGGHVLHVGSRAAIAGATVTCAGAGGGTATSDATGAWSLLVTDGSYVVSASSPGLALAGSVSVNAPPGRNDIELLLGTPQLAVTPDRLDFVVDQDASATLPLSLANGGDLALAATVESVGRAWSATGLWHLASWRSAPGAQAWYYGRDDTRTFDTGAANSGTLTLPPVTIPADATTLSFREWRHTETGSLFDLCVLEASSDQGATWSVLHQSTTITSVWRLVEVPAATLGGADILLRFRFDTFDSIENNLEGWYIDDVRLDGRLIGQWLTNTPVALSVSPGGAGAVSVRADAAGLTPGTYAGSVTVSSNAPANPLVHVPVQLTVRGAPVMAAGGIAIDDGAVSPAAGDGDGWPEPGESLSLAVTLHNAGYETAEGLVATLVSDHARLQITSAATTYANLPIGGSLPNQLPLAVRIAADCPDRTVLPMHLAVQDALGRTWSVPFSLTVQVRGKISGTARRISDGAAIPGVSISLGGLTTLSAADGSYAIRDIPAGTYTVTASKSGYADTIRVASVPPDLVWDPVFGERQLTVTPPSLALTTTRHGSRDDFLHLASSGELPVTWAAQVVSNQYAWDHSGQPGGPVYAWTDIRDTGTLIAIAGDDLNTGPLPLGFSFPFYAASFDTFRVCSNGWISFTSSSWTYTTSALPSLASPENLIAALWADLYVDGSSTVHFSHPRADRCVIQFTNVAYYGSSTSRSTFQLILDRDGTIVLQYQRVDNPTRAVVGIQDAGRTLGLTVSNNQPLLQPGMAIRIRRSTDWLHLPIASGTLPPGAVSDLTVHCIPAGLPIGTYAATILLASDDSDTPSVSVPVTLTVENPHAPTANPQHVDVVRDVPRLITLAGADADDDPLVFTVVTAPLHGVLSGSGDALTYTPASGYLGLDSFSFTTHDGDSTSPPAVVSIDVQPAASPTGGTSASSNAGGGGSGCGAGALGLLLLGGLGFGMRRRQPR